MTSEYLESQLARWRLVFWLYAGGAAVLLLIALVDLPSRLSQPAGVSMPVDGWMGAWFLLLIGSLSAGVLLLANPGWRAAPAGHHLPLAFAHLAVAWFLLVAFSLRTAAWGAWWPLVAVAGAALGAASWLVRRRVDEEMFP